MSGGDRTRAEGARGVMLCADDYGMSPGIDAAILALAERRRLTAVSCVTNGERWRTAAANLRGRTEVEIGLHVVLTDGPSVGGPNPLAPSGRFPDQRALLWNSLSGRIDRAQLRREIEAQIERFVAGVGRMPDFFDGHQLVHQFPVIRHVVIECVRAANPRAWLRWCGEPLAHVVRRTHGLVDAASAAVMGAGLARAAQRAGVPVNLGYSGFYDVRGGRRFRDIFPSFLAHLGARHLVVCHPGRCGDDRERATPWMRTREHEFEYLASDEFPTCLRAHEVELRRFHEFGDGARTSPRPAWA